MMLNLPPKLNDMLSSYPELRDFVEQNHQLAHTLIDKFPQLSYDDAQFLIKDLNNQVIDKLSQGYNLCFIKQNPDGRYELLPLGFTL